MHDAPTASLPIANRILAVLPLEEFALLQPHLELVSFPNGHLVALAGDSLKKCFFPNRGMISLLAETQHGYAVEAAYTGCEGMVGIPVVLGKNVMPYQALVQAPSEGYIVDTGRVLQLFARGGVFHDIVLRYAYVEMRQIAQTAVCNHFHDIRSRLCRWLTVMCERSGDKYLKLTQEFLAHILGVQRTSIGPIAALLQHDGIIRYRRGKVEIVDFDRLQSAACECYRIIKKEYAEFPEAAKPLAMSGRRQTAKV